MTVCRTHSDAVNQKHCSKWRPHLENNVCLAISASVHSGCADQGAGRHLLLVEGGLHVVPVDQVPAVPVCTMFHVHAAYSRLQLGHPMCGSCLARLVAMCSRQVYCYTVCAVTAATGVQCSDYPRTRTQSHLCQTVQQSCACTDREYSVSLSAVDEGLQHLLDLGAMQHADSSRPVVR